MVGISRSSRAAPGFRASWFGMKGRDMPNRPRRGLGLRPHEPIHGDPSMAGTRAGGTSRVRCPGSRPAGHQFAGAGKKVPVWIGLP